MTNSKCSTILAVFQLYIVLQLSLAVLDVQEYCAKFPENLRPIICILRENKLVPKRSSSTTQDPWTTDLPWNESESEEDEPTCGCDLNCFPPPPA
ncbi:unnamed protein product [Allacma fusca]|uniref:Secreted protein n=1 Tax=Allacma fusca TaxID=39272 RepID=A0A8J2KYK2_9HEXA|nr:unnamed protein product [Allacma fusca]